ncbi:UMP kinase [Candidatus Pacearchaeota archaeon]|nr:UMP kinase [Candidatus Pacearchaeota archaeon]
MKKVVVISLGGSLIIPDKIDIGFLRHFKKVIRKNLHKYSFVIVCGGGSIARKYISALNEIGVSEKLQNYAGISATRTNARFMSYLFNQDPERGIPQKIKQVKSYLRNQNVVFCGGLEYKPNQTSDSSAAAIARNFGTTFINITNVKGLYDKNPKEFKNAKFIPRISWEEFYKMASKLNYKPGQHFALDQTAARMILNNKTLTYIIGKDLKQLNNLLNNKEFIGTRIEG